MIATFMIGFFMGGIIGITMSAILNIAEEDQEDEKTEDEE